MAPERRQPPPYVTAIRHRHTPASYASCKRKATGLNALLTLYERSIQAPLRLYSDSFKPLLRRVFEAEAEEAEAEEAEAEEAEEGEEQRQERSAYLSATSSTNALRLPVRTLASLLTLFCGKLYSP